LLPSVSSASRLGSSSMDSFTGASVEEHLPRLFINWTVLQQMMQNYTDGAQIKHTLSGRTHDEERDAPQRYDAHDRSVTHSLACSPPRLALHLAQSAEARRLAADLLL
jgi:hypothetical protein